MLWRDLRCLQVYGANTDVGKTIVSTLLCKAWGRRVPDGRVLYIKPVSTGPEAEADDRHITRHAPNTVSRCFSQFSSPVSPHLAARGAPDPPSDGSILTKLKGALAEYARSGGHYALVETAGGVLSPGPSGNLQADLYRPLRLPVVLVGDAKLGGISTTLSAFESLHVRGYTVDSVLLFDDQTWGNREYLHDHFKRYEVETFGLPMPPPRHASPEEDDSVMQEYYDNTSTGSVMRDVVDLLHHRHLSRISKLTAMPDLTESIIWHPFRQYGLPTNIIAIDSAYGDHFEAYQADPVEEKPSTTTLLTPLATPGAKAMLTPMFDGSASWWTQGLGHGNPDLALTAAHAAGRYGHVMFGNAAHEPALDLSYNLLSTLANPRLSRVFFSDNGSTGMEVAVKMALRAACARYGWNKEQDNVEILGLSGSYHGDTMGVMNCSEPSVFNEKVDWHQARGFWFHPPHLQMRKGVWELEIPNGLSSSADSEIQRFANLEHVFDYAARYTKGHAQAYESAIKATLDRLVKQQGRTFGGLIMEPILMGAGGMIFVDPLFQRTLIKVVRESPDLISKSQQDHSRDTRTWSGLPVIADEVFTGLFRLGRASSSSLFSSDPATGTLDVDIAPDISVHAKLLTGGLLPLAITTASDSIFDVFRSDKKSDALLHGHSYTAHAVGCAVANKSLSELHKISNGADWADYQQPWNSSTASSPTIFSFFSPTLISRLSHHPRIDGVFALGTVLVIRLLSTDSSSYASNAAANLQEALLNDLGEHGGGAIHSRVLGNVLYLMTSLTTKREAVAALEERIVRALK